MCMFVLAKREDYLDESEDSVGRNKAQKEVPVLETQSNTEVKGKTNLKEMRRINQKAIRLVVYSNDLGAAGKNGGGATR